MCHMILGACGLSGASDSVDCVHFVWDCCPTGHRSACAGKGKVPILVFQMVVLNSKCILSMSQYFWGMFNDHTVLHLNPVFDLIHNGGILEYSKVTFLLL